MAMRGRTYNLFLAIVWFLLGVVVLLRDVIIPDEYRQRFNLPYPWLVVLVAGAMVTWNGLRWRRGSKPTDHFENPLYKAGPR
jgi:hypothetical protein